MSHLAALREIQSDMREIVETYPNTFIFGILGYINASLGCAAITAGVVEKQVDGRYEVQPGQIRTFLDEARSGQVSIAPCSTWVSEYLKRFWPQASSSLPTVRKIRKKLAEVFEIFTYEPKQKTPWYKGTPKPMAPALERFDVAKALMLFEVCEQVLKDRGLTLDDFPKHRGGVMVEMFNWVFRGIAKFGRVDDLLFGGLCLFYEAIEVFEDLFFVGSRIVGEVCDKIAQAMMDEERSYYSEAEIPY